MRRKTLAAAVLATALLAAPSTRAQPMAGGGGMPDLSRIVGRPLAVPGMPTGTVSVRVGRKMPVNTVKDVEVSAIIKGTNGESRKRVLKTDESGHALFEGMRPGDQFRAEVNLDGEHLQTETFTLPPEGGLKTMLLSGLAGGGGAPAGGPAGAAPEGGSAEGGAPAAGGEQRPFALGATAGSATEDASLPVGTLEVRLRDEAGAPIANHSVLLGMVNKQGEVESRRGKSDNDGLVRFTGLPAGKSTGYAAVIEWRGLRLNTSPFAMPEVGGARAEIRALARTADPSVVTIGTGGRLVVQLNEDQLQFLEFLPLENTSDRMFDPGPGAFEIPLPREFAGAQPQENERKVEVRQGHGIAVHGAIVPKRMQLAATDADRRAEEVVFGFVLPYHDDTLDFSQPVPNGIGGFTLITEQKVAGLTVSGPGVGAREERTLGGRKYWVMPVTPVPAGGAITFTLSGLPSNASWGRTFVFWVSIALFLSAFVFARTPQSGKGGKTRSVEEERKRLRDKREALFAELVTLERVARTAGTPAPAEQRQQLVARLEQVYQDLAALDERRAA